jgi:ribosome-binding protein aMBF1 (putative translation factor)
MATNWKNEHKNLGVDPDVEIAKRLGVTKERVRQERKKLNIPRAARKLRRVEVTGEAAEKDIAKYLYAVPLSARDRQVITDARVARGWSQKQLAKRIRSSLTFIYLIETGKKSPSPEYLNRMCKALGLEWSCQFWLQIGPRRQGRGVRRAKS